MDTSLAPGQNDSFSGAMTPGFLRPLQSFWRQSPSWRKSAIEAMWHCTRARLVISVIPFSRIAKTLGEPQAESECVPLSVADDEIIREVSSAIKAAARRLPWKCECLVQAIAARKMLEKRGAEGTFYFGMRKSNTDGELEAHAWTRCGDQIVTGADQRQGHQVLSTFRFGKN